MKEVMISVTIAAAFLLAMALIAYAIATSDLPPWFKFWLLK